MADKKLSVGHVFRLLMIAAKLDLVWLLRDTKYALVAIIGDLIANLSTVSGVFLIAVRFDGIGGMSADEILFMLAYSTLITGVFITFGTGNNIHISRIIGRGQLEHMFIQPLSLKVQLLTCGFTPFTGFGNLLIGAVLMWISMDRMAMRVDFLWFLSLIGFLLLTMVVIIARSYLVSTAAFYAPVACEEISYTAIDGTWFMSTFPLSGMPSFIQIPLITVLPEGLMAWFPTLCLLGKPPLGLDGSYMVFFALLLSIAAGIIFRKGLRFYVQRGSNRYVPYGFRR